jgi:FMN phosphatase YigB (HAD superfamily)
LRNIYRKISLSWSLKSENKPGGSLTSPLDSLEQRPALPPGFYGGFSSACLRHPSPDRVKAYPDVPPAIQALSAAAIRLGFLSNLTEANIKNAGLEGRFEQLLSTDRVQAYKPDPRAYQMGIDALGCQNRRSSSRLWRLGVPPGRKVSATRLAARTD